MRKILVIISTLVLSIVLISCSKKDTSKDINVALAFSPMDGILDLIKDDVKKDGYNLKYEMFSRNYLTPNVELSNKNFDANMIQHEYFMDSFNKGNNGSLVHGMNIYHATFALYSRDNVSPENIPNGTEIAVPSDSTNLGRAILLLRDAQLLTLKDNDIVLPTTQDIETSKVVLQPVDLPGIANIYKETKYAVMYPTDATTLEIKGDDQRVFVEDNTLERVQKFAISLVVRDDNKDSEKITILKKHLNTQKVRDYILEVYGWASTPAF